MPTMTKEELEAENTKLRAQLAAALSWLDDFDAHGILDVTAFCSALRRALNPENHE